jgi:hypothetical protein
MGVPGSSFATIRTGRRAKEAAQWGKDGFDVGVERRMFVRVHIPQSLGHVKAVGSFSEGALSDVQEMRAFARRSARKAFNDVRGN